MITLHEDAQRTSRLTTIALAMVLATTLAACGKEGAKAENAASAAKPAEQAGAKKDDHAAGEKAGGHAEGAEELTLTTEEAERAGVKVEEIKARALGETLVVTATIRPDQERLARVAARIEGRITSVPAKLGDKVRAGQTLATLDSVAVGEAHAALNQAQAELGIAEADFKRAQSLGRSVPRQPVSAGFPLHTVSCGWARSAAAVRSRP